MLTIGVAFLITHTLIYYVFNFYSSYIYTCLTILQLFNIAHVQLQISTVHHVYVETEYGGFELFEHIHASS